MMRVVSLLLLAATSVADTRVVVGDFSHGDLSGWSNKTFDGQTHYSLVSVDGHRALKAISRDAASGLYRTIHVDLEKTPYLHWSWRVDNTLANVDEHSKAGDDYPARVYVIFSGGVFFWRTRAINYVWSSNQPPGSTWHNAFTGNARMIAVRSGKDAGQRWLAERRDIRRDYHRLFGDDIRYTDAVAIMTDTDNSHQSAVAYYGDIYFSAQ